MTKAANGDRKGGQECGLRICNTKYMFIRNVSTKEGINYCTMSCKGGGACVAKTSKTLLIGTWNKELKMSNSQNQNTGDCEKNVLGVANILKSGGF